MSWMRGSALGPRRETPNKRFEQTIRRALGSLWQKASWAAYCYSSAQR
jgi:hypothetical protein